MKKQITIPCIASFFTSQSFALQRTALCGEPRLRFPRKEGLIGEGKPSPYTNYNVIYKRAGLQLQSGS